jgi:hypothetical protein
MFALDPVTSHGSAAAVGAAALYAWIKAGPLLIAKLGGKSNGNGNGNGAMSDLKLEVALAPLNASAVRMEAALGRMENTQGQMNNTLIEIAAGFRGRRD